MSLVLLSPRWRPFPIVKPAGPHLLINCLWSVRLSAQAYYAPIRYAYTRAATEGGKTYKLRRIQFARPQQASSEFYSYTPLRRPGSNIRLIEILPGDGVYILCKLHIADLDNITSFAIDGKPRTYEALSYTWDHQTLAKTVICDGKVLYVAQNIYDALHTLRRPTSSRIFWIDAICINQSDTDERSHQVGLMRFIYNRATLVTSWLGKEDEYTAPAINLIDRIVKNHVSADVSLKAHPSAIWDNRMMDKMDLPHFPSFEWEALAQLFKQAYFRRIWVVQEMVVASKAVVRCGFMTIRWDYVEYIAQSLLSTGWVRALKQVYGSEVTPQFAQTISNCKGSFSELRGGQGIPLSLLLSATRRFQATDPKDKVIALVGLADHRSLGVSASTILNYSKPVANLYTEITGYLIHNERSLNLLSSVEDISDRRVAGLPSWVPDYSVRQHPTILGTSIRVAHLNFHAAGDTSVSVRWPPSSRVLFVDGFCYDDAEIVSTDSLEQHSDDKHVIRQWLQIAEPLIRRGVIGIDEFWMTIIGNQRTDIYPASEQYGTHLERYVSHATTARQGSLGAKDARDHSTTANSLFSQAALGYLAPCRKFFTTKGGCIGLGPRSMRPEDLVCILSGGRVPFVLREEGNYHRLVGESYVLGLMDGQAVKNKTMFREFRLH
ncbi:hypothetical protein MMC28_005001 [Mycoblastus sanguinarius]|nr:hypothetical protein [Mycoblastus sanguinarius]